MLPMLLWMDSVLWAVLDVADGWIDEMVGIEMTGVNWTTDGMKNGRGHLEVRELFYEMK